MHVGAKHEHIIFFIWLRQVTTFNVTAEANIQTMLNLAGPIVMNVISERCEVCMVDSNVAMNGQVRWRMRSLTPERVKFHSPAADTFLHYIKLYVVSSDICISQEMEPIGASCGPHHDSVTPACGGHKSSANGRPFLIPTWSLAVGSERQTIRACACRSSSGSRRPSDARVHWLEGLRERDRRHAAGPSTGILPHRVSSYISLPGSITRVLLAGFTAG
jgi:hypothetical protein